jgi:hypothetical protein
VTQISIARDAYERVRTEATLFLVAPGHERPDLEDVIEEHGNHHVVRKRLGLPQRALNKQTRVVKQGRRLPDKTTAPTVEGGLGAEGRRFHGAPGS